MFFSILAHSDAMKFTTKNETFGKSASNDDQLDFIQSIDFIKSIESLTRLTVLFTLVCSLECAIYVSPIDSPGTTRFTSLPTHTLFHFTFQNC